MGKIFLYKFYKLNPVGKIRIFSPKIQFFPKKFSEFSHPFFAAKAPFCAPKTLKKVSHHRTGGVVINFCGPWERVRRAKKRGGGGWIPPMHGNQKFQKRCKTREKRLKTFFPNFLKIFPIFKAIFLYFP